VRPALAAAACVVAATLADDSLAPSRLSHARSPLALAGAGALAVALVALVPRARSLTMSLAAGVAAGGSAATLVAGVAWRDGVPNPLVRGGIAFNVADLAVGAGDAFLIGAALLHAWQGRDRLFETI